MHPFLKMAVALSLVAAMATIILAPAFRSARYAAQAAACKNNLKRLANALNMYAEDWDGHYPPANAWMDRIDNDKYLEPGRTDVFHCPAADSPYGYAMNAQMGGKSAKDIDVVNTVLLFETDAPARNANGNQNSMAHPRHASLNCVFCGGTAAWVNLYTQQHWKWTIPKP